MARVGFALAVTFGILLVFVASLIRGNAAKVQAEPRVHTHQTRTAETDLELRGLENSSPRFISRADLDALPQVEALLRRDENFVELPESGVLVRGVRLEVLERALAVLPKMSLEATCGDGYAPSFPVDYVKQHHPILVLTIEGISTKAWAEKTHTIDLGPYFVAYDSFVPAFQALSHTDRPQVPAQIVRLQFAPERQMFAGILPGRTTDSTIGQGYRIAQQNCFRCHNAAGYGGTKAGRDWKTLSKDARERPEWFANWLHDPQSMDAKAQMPPNPKYDRATLTAITKYFSTMK